MRNRKEPPLPRVGRRGLRGGCEVQDTHESPEANNDSESCAWEIPLEGRLLRAAHVICRPRTQVQQQRWFSRRGWRQVEGPHWLLVALVHRFQILPREERNSGATVRPFP